MEVKMATLRHCGCNLIPILTLIFLSTVSSLSLQSSQSEDNSVSSSDNGAKTIANPTAENSKSSAKNENNSSNIQQHPLRITLQKKFPVIMINLNSDISVKMNYTLRCTEASTVYVVFAKSMSEEVATITKGNPVIISCNQNINRTSNKGYNKDSRNSFTNSSNGHTTIVQNGHAEVENKQIVPASSALESSSSREMFEVSGEFSMEFRGHEIGRSFFLMFANKVSRQGNLKNKVTFGPGRSQRDTLSVINVNHDNDDDNGGDDTDENKKNNDNTQGVISKRMGVKRPGMRGKGGKKLPPNTVVKSMIIVMQFPRPIDKIFRIILYIVIITATIGMGVKVELKVIKDVMRKPFGPCIGLFCQYICMPLIAYFIAKTIPQPSPAISFGIFTCGIVPGGGASNFFCYLLGGDVTLSVTMTILSSVLALGMIPLWLFTLGPTFNDENADLHVPYLKVLETLSIALLPVFVGMFIKLKLPKLAKIFSMILKPFLIIIVLFMLSVGIYANFYIFSMIRPMQIVAGLMLPYIGYLLGGTIAFFAGRSWSHIKTIAIETGIQNVGVAFMMVFFSLPPPDNQLAVVAPAASAIMTPLPLIVTSIIYTVHLCIKRKKSEKKDGLLEDNEGKKKNGENKDDTSSETDVNKNTPIIKLKRLGLNIGGDDKDIDKIKNDDADENLLNKISDDDRVNDGENGENANTDDHSNKDEVYVSLISKVIDRIRGRKLEKGVAV